MNTLARFLLAVFGLGIGIGTSIVVCIKGWGLQPQSWFWIIPGYFMGHIAAYLIVEVSNHLDDDK